MASREDVCKPFVRMKDAEEVKVKLEPLDFIDVTHGLFDVRVKEEQNEEPVYPVECKPTGRLVEKQQEQSSVSCQDEFSPAASSKAPPHKYSSQTRNIIMNVFKYFTKEDNLATITELTKITAEATGVSCKTVARIRSEARKTPDGIIRSRPKSVRVAPILGQVDDFEKDCIKRELLAFYDRGEVPTVAAVLEKVKAPPTNFKGSRTSLYKILKQLGFKYKQAESGRKMLDKSKWISWTDTEVREKQ